MVSENGAGKFTSIKVLGGVHRPDRGALLVGGIPRRLHATQNPNPRRTDARRGHRRQAGNLCHHRAFPGGAGGSHPNLVGARRNPAIVGILAVGQTFAGLTAGIDLSVKAVLGLSVVLFARLLEHHGLIIAIPLGLLSGAAAGLVNGIGIAYGCTLPFIMTLGMLSFARGLAFIYTGGTPIPALMLIAALVVCGIVLRLTPFGRSVYASQLSAETPIAGQGYELDAIAAVVVGGTSLFGGAGFVFGTFVGTLIIGVLANMLNLTGVDPFVQQLFKGALIVIAVFVMSRPSRG